MTDRYRMTDQWRRPHGSENDRSMLIGPGPAGGGVTSLPTLPPDSDEKTQTREDLDKKTRTRLAKIVLKAGSSPVSGAGTSRAPYATAL